MLREIKKPNRDHARRLFQCLVVAIRPLYVEELAEVLAVDFEDAEGIPKLKPSWRWEDQEQALLTSCSSLITIIDTGLSRVVQFSHFSVKEFLISARLAASTQDVSRYHIVFGPAHTIMAQASLSILLGVDGLAEDNSVEISPLAKYAAEYWARHAQFEDVASRIKGMEVLFDPDKPYFATWCQLHDIDPKPSHLSVFYQFAGSKSGEATPLYYAALCGFSNIVEKLIVEHPEQVGAIGGYYWTPAVAALVGRNFHIAKLLHLNGSSVNPPGGPENTTLHSAAAYGDLEMVQVLVLDYGIDVDVRNTVDATPLIFASIFTNTTEVVRWLLDHGANPNAPVLNGSTPLHQAIFHGRMELAPILVEHGANVETKDEEGTTPLDYATDEQRDEIIKLLLEHRAE